MGVGSSLFGSRSSGRFRGSSSTCLVFVRVLVAVLMSVAAKLAWIQQRFDEGASVKLHIGPSDVEERDNLKVTIRPGQIGGASLGRSRLRLQRQILENLSEILESQHVVEHSHDHTSGATVVTFHCTPRVRRTRSSTTVTPHEDDDLDSQPPEDEKENEQSGQSAPLPRQHPRCSRKAGGRNDAGDSCSLPKKPRTADGDVAAGSGKPCPLLFDIYSDAEENAPKAGSDAQAKCQMVSNASQTQDSFPSDAVVQILSSPAELNEAAIASNIYNVCNSFSRLDIALQQITSLEAPLLQRSLLIADLETDSGAETVLDECNEALLVCRRRLFDFQFAYAESLEYLDLDWKAETIAWSVLIDIPADDDDQCMRYTNFALHSKLHADLQMFYPYCASASHISVGEASDAVKDFGYAYQADCNDLEAMVKEVEGLFEEDCEMTFLQFLSKRSNDYDSACPLYGCSASHDIRGYNVNDACRRVRFL